MNNDGNLLPHDNKRSLFTSIANVIAATFSHKYSLNDGVNNSIFAVVLAGITWASTNSVYAVLNRPSFRKSFIRNLNPMRLLNKSKYKDCEIKDEMMVSKFVEYMRCYSNFYNCSHDLVIGDMQIQFDQMRDPISFVDKNFNVDGKIQFFEEKEIKILHPPPSIDTPEKITDDANNNLGAGYITGKRPIVDTNQIKPQIEIVHIYINLYDCVCNDLADYIKNVIHHETKTTIVGKTMHYDISGTFYVKMVKYINLYKTYYYPDKTIITDETNDIFFEQNKTILFDDKLFGVRGYIKWIQGTITLMHCDILDEHENKRNICAQSNEYTIKQYIGDINTHIINLEKKENRLVLRNYFILNKSFQIEYLYDNIDKDPIVLEKLFIDTLFHKDIASLWQQIKTINYHPEQYYKMGMTPRMNLLLHGPPGTGKSTFAYRIAMATKRHIINLKLNQFTKTELHKIFRSPTIGDIQHKPEEIVYVLDEFDIDLEGIIAKSVCKEKQMEQIEETITSFFQTMVCVNEPSAKQEKEDGSEKISDVADKINKIGGYLDTMTQTYDKINDIGVDIIRIDDLLTIFQGATPIEGCIIIAMTNKFEQLRDKCPPLFRPGRLTPIYFGNFDIKMINEVTSYYFGKKVSTDVEESTVLEISPAHVIDIIASSQLKTNKGFEYFLEKLSEDSKIIFREVIEAPKENLDDIVITSIFSANDPTPPEIYKISSISGTIVSNDEFRLFDSKSRREQIIYNPSNVNKIILVRTHYVIVSTRENMFAVCLEQPNMQNLKNIVSLHEIISPSPHCRYKGNCKYSVLNREIVCSSKSHCESSGTVIFEINIEKFSTRTYYSTQSSSGSLIVGGGSSLSKNVVASKTTY